MNDHEDKSSLMSPAYPRHGGHKGNRQRIIDIVGLERDKKGWRKADKRGFTSPFPHEDNASVHVQSTKNRVKDLSRREGTQNGFQGALLNEDQIVCHCKGSSVKILEKMNHVGDMSAQHPQWLREKFRKKYKKGIIHDNNDQTQ